MAEAADSDVLDRQARLADLLRLLELEPLEVNLFRGQSRDIGAPQVFGGQVLGQALVAASRTVEGGRLAHSAHAYFLRRGDVEAPIVYQVDRSRDGNHFTSRRVVAIQHGVPILTMSASFQAPEPGYEHQVAPLEVPPPESLPDLEAYGRSIVDRVPERLQLLFAHRRAFEFRAVQLPEYFEPTVRPPLRQVWFRAPGQLPDDPALHRSLLAYVSDYHLLEASLMPHAVSLFQVQAASIDHAIWFHRDVRVDDWLLYSMESPSSSGARGFSRGSIYTRDGRLVASTAQEGLIRPNARWTSRPGRGE